MMARPEKRRVPICAINWCCPYRSDLCKDRCTGERIPADSSMIVGGGFVYIREAGNSFVKYALPPKTKAAFRGFDRGDPSKDLVGEYTFEAVDE